MDVKIPLIKKKVKYFLSCKEMTLWHYDQYLESNDLRYFTNYFDLKNPKEPNPLVVKKSFDLIFGEMLSITENYEVITKFENTDKIYKLKVKYEDVKRLIEAIRLHLSFIDPIGIPLFVEQLKKWNYRIDPKKDYLPQIEKIERRVEGLKSEIESLGKKINKDNDKEKVDLEEMIYSVERHLDLKYQIDKKKISLYKWLLMQKEVSKKIELQRKHNKK